MVRSAAAVVIALAATAAAVAAADHAAAAALVAAAAEQDEQDDDPQTVVAAEAIVVIHRDTSEDGLLSGLTAHSMLFPKPDLVTGAAVAIGAAGWYTVRNLRDKEKSHEHLA